MARLPGKKFDTWHYERNRQEVDVPVRVNGLRFLVVMPELGINVTDETLPALQKKVFALLDEKLSLEWKPFLYIQVSGGTGILRSQPKADDDDSETWGDDDDKLSDQAYREKHPEDNDLTLNLNVEVTNWELTTGPTGQNLSRQLGYNGGSYTHKDWPETGKKEDRYDRGDKSIRALVPDTPATREALNLLSRDLQRLTDRLQELFVPERVDQTLALAASGVKLLAPAKGDA